MAQGNETGFGSRDMDQTALKGNIYYIPEGTSALPDFSTLTPVGSIYTETLNVSERSFDTGFPGVTDRFEWFAIKYTGTFQVENEGEYNFRLVSDDGSRLFIDGNKIIDNDGTHPTQSVSGNASLSKGQHQIEVDYFQGPRYYVALQLFWTPPGSAETTANPQYVPENNSSIKNVDLTGVWSCDDGGTYYIRHLGDTIWWFGEKYVDPGDWSNVAYGTLKGNITNLNWSDVPKGCALGSGTLVLSVLSKDELTATDKTGNFGGSNWKRIGSTACPTSKTPQGNKSEPWEDPNVRQLIDEWLLQQDKCVKQVYGSGAYIDKWGRVCGDVGDTRITCNLAPDHPLDWDNYHYLWFNNYCPEYYPYTVQGYVSYRQAGYSFEAMAGCKSKNAACIA